DRLWRVPEVATVDHVDALLPEQLGQPGELLSVFAALAVRVVLVAEADVGRVGGDPFGFPIEAISLEFKGAPERFGLEAPRELMSVRRIGALHRIAYQDEQLYAGQVARDPLRGQGVEHVVRARLERHRAGADGPLHPLRVRLERKVCPVPGDTAVI